MSVIVTGSVAYDYLMSFPGRFKEHILPDRLDNISLSFLVDTMVRQRGGTGPNIAFTLALLGEKPKLVATVGPDFTEYRAWLESHGVDTSLTVVIPEAFTASFFANTDQDNNQISSFYAGAMAYATQASLRSLTAKPDLVIISPNDPKAMDQYVTECKALGIRYLYDPSQQVVRVSGEELRHGVEGAHSLFVNKYEFELLQKHTGMSAEQIIGSTGFTVVTLGGEGAVIYAEGKEYRVPVFRPKEILDPTGVGDAFRGGFVRAYLLGLDWELCGKVGALAAAYCLETRGPQEHAYTPTEFVTRFRQQFDDGGKLNILAA
ncbi:MAG: carbohydrate kinase family protein [Anaerolineaceae bacterium]|nr:carbohydrate kinase family protein [Anaerolineaceae bacterium]